jgi:hypothetical protein
MIPKEGRLNRLHYKTFYDNYYQLKHKMQLTLPKPV